MNGKRCEVAHDNSQHIQRAQTSLGFQGTCKVNSPVRLLYLPSARRRSRLYKTGGKLFCQTQFFTFFFGQTNSEKQVVGLTETAKAKKAKIKDLHEAKR